MRGRICTLVAAVAVLAAVLVAGCGGEAGPEAGETRSQESQKPQADDQKLKPIRLTLEGYPDVENVGVLMADQHGHFADVGLDVEVFFPIDSDNVPEYVAGGLNDVGLLPQPEVVISRKKGMPLVAIGSLVQRPTMAMIWPKSSRIDGVADLKGKTVAINGLSSEEGILRAVLAQAGLAFDDVEVKSVAYLLVPALISGRVDAILGSGNVEGIELEGRGLNPVVTSVQRFDIPSYEDLVAVTRRDRLAGNAPWIRSFRTAVARGTAAAVEDPEAAAKAIATARADLEAPASPPKLVKAKVEATLPLLSGSGSMSPGQATDLEGWMRAQGLIR